MDIARTIVFIFVFLIINVSIYFQLYRFFLKSKKFWQIIIISILYWLGAIFTENFFPFITVMILIFGYHRGIGEDEYIRNADIWEFDLSILLKVTVQTLFFKMAISLINLAYVLFINRLTAFDIKPQEIVVDFYQSDLYTKLFLFLLIVVFAPFVEEYVFRYFIYDKFLLSYMPAIYAALLSAVIFTIAHYNAGGVPSFFGLALFCNYVYEKRGYFAAVVVHLIFNLSTVLLLIFY